MTAQNAAHGCDCGKVKVTLLNKRNAAETLTAPLNGKAIAIGVLHAAEHAGDWTDRGFSDWTHTIFVYLQRNTDAVRGQRLGHRLRWRQQRIFPSYQRAKVRRYVGSNGGTHGHAPSYQSSAVQLCFAKNKQLSSTKGTGGFTVRFLFLLFSKNFSKKCWQTTKPVVK